MTEYIRSITENWWLNKETKYEQPCAHDGCSMCHGTGIKADGSYCIHNLYCSCPKCSPQC